MKSRKVFNVIGLVLTLALVATGVIAYSSGAFSYSDSIIIYGSNAAATDTVGAEEISDSIIANIPANITIIPGNESLLIKAHGNDLNFGETLSSIITKVIDKDMPELLASNSVEYQDGSEEDYTQVLRLGNDSVNFGSLDSEDYVINKNLSADEVPILYLDLSKSYLWELEVKFGDYLDATELDNSEMVIADKSYIFKPNIQKDDKDIMLYASGQKVTLKLNEEQTVIVGGKSTTLKVVGANEGENDNPDEVLIQIDGTLKKIKQGNSLAINGDRIYANDIFIRTVPEYDVTTELFIGAEELKLSVDNGFNDIEVNGKTLDGISASVITQNKSLDKLQKILFRFTPSELDNATDEINYLEIGESITDPLFKTISLTFGADTETLDSASRDYLNVRSLGESLKVTFTNEDSDEIEFVPYEVKDGFLNSTLVNGTVGMEENLFLVQVSDVTEVFRIEDINSNSGEVDIYSYIDDSSKTYKVGDEIGGDTGVLINEINTTNVTFSKASSTILNTENKMKVTLYPDRITFDESNIDTGESSIVPTKTSVGLTLNSDDDIEIGSVIGNYTTQDRDKNDNYEYTITNGFVTYFIRDTDNYRELKVYIPAEEMDFKAYLSSSLTVQQTTPSDYASLAMSDVTVDATSANKDMIIVGGPCINQAAMKVLEITSPLCGEEFTAKTGVGAGQYIIQVFDNPYATGKKAILIAGYEAADTTRAVNAILNTPINLSVGSKIIG